MPGVMIVLVALAIVVGQAYSTRPQQYGGRSAGVLTNADTWRNIGLFILLCACAAYIWGRREMAIASVPTDRVVAVADFTKRDLTGRLHEVLLDGYFHPDQMVKVQFPRTMKFLTGETLLIPVTPADWRVGDPVRVYILPNGFGVGTVGQDLVDALAREGFGPQGSGPVRQTRLLAKAELFAFNGDVRAVVAKAGVPTDGPVQILTISEGTRVRALERSLAAQGTLMIFLGVIGAALVGASYLARRFGLRRAG